MAEEAQVDDERHLAATNLSVGDDDAGTADVLASGTSARAVGNHRVDCCEDHLLELLYTSTFNEADKRATVSRILQTDDRSLSFYGSLLSMVCSVETIASPTTLRHIQSLLQEFPEAAHYCDPQTGRTALHEAIEGHRVPSMQPALVRMLVETNPAIVRVRDSEELSMPIDSLAGVALMREERLKYLTKSVDSRRDTSLQEVERDLENIWNCARYLVLDPALFDRDIPVLHALLAGARGGASNVPMSLLEQVARYQSLAQADWEGNLPLHIICDLRRRPQQQMDTNADENDDGDDEEEDEEVPGESSLHLLRKILQNYPAAAQMRNHADQLPVDLAIESGRRWETGIALLVEAYPLAGLDRRFATQHYPLVLDQLLNQRHCTETVYSLLSSNPKALTVYKVDQDGSAIARERGKDPPGK